MTVDTHERFQDIVLKGAYVPLGMARWDDVLSTADADAIHAYVIAQASAAAAPVAAAAPGAAAASAVPAQGAP
jgi:quinohemoprotein ethanol dehydrogenase